MSSVHFWHECILLLNGTQECEKFATVSLYPEEKQLPKCIPLSRILTSVSKSLFTFRLSAKLEHRLLKQTFFLHTCTVKQGACERWPIIEHSRWELGILWVFYDKRSLTFSCHASNHNNHSADTMPRDNNPFAGKAGRFLGAIVLGLCCPL